MNNHLPLSDSLLDCILSSAVAIQSIDHLDCVLVCTSDQGNMRTWMHYHPYLYKVKECNVHDIMPCYKPKDTIENFIFIPISLRTATYEQLIRMNRHNPNLIATQTTTSGLRFNSENLVIHTNPQSGAFVVVARTVDTFSAMDKLWLLIWRGFNWNYMESDDPQVWLNYEKAIAANRKLGRQYGLSNQRMDELMTHAQTA